MKLADPTVVVGRYHALAGAAVMTVLLAVLADHHRRSGVLLLAVGLTASTVAMLVRGAHRILAIAAPIAVAGAILTVATLHRRSAAGS